MRASNSTAPGAVGTENPAAGMVSAVKSQPAKTLENVFSIEIL